MTNIQEELKLIKKLLKTEWKEDLEQYKRKTFGRSLAERKADGICWYPVSVSKTKTGLADKLLVEVTHADPPSSHGFQSGKSVSLFSNTPENDSSRDRVSGVVNYVRGNRLMMTLGVENAPDWLDGGKLGVDLLFDENTYRQMDAAMDNVINANQGRLNTLKEILLGDTPPATTLPVKLDLDEDWLNESQLAAVQLVCSARDVAIIHGPPGTGKTTTLVASIHETLKRMHQVMVCAPSNAAVDLLVEKLVQKGIATLRIGHPARVDDDILNQTLDAKTSQHGSYKTLKKLKKEVAELRRKARQFKRNFSHQQRAQRQYLYDQVSQARREIDQLEDYIRFDIFQQTQVFACTFSGAGSQALKGMRFPVVFMDEAAQGLEPATWIPILTAEKVVMAGDHCQLPPTIKSFEAAAAGLRQTLFEKVIERQPQSARMLAMQYRMPELIMGFSSKIFYKNQLRAAPVTASHRLGPEEPILTFIDTAGSGFADFTDRETLSTQNPEEARFALGVMNSLLKRIGSAVFDENDWKIGLISPYRGQVELLKTLVRDDDSFLIIKSMRERLTIDTIDGFQGQERDLILISLVRSNARGEIGFLSDTRRMNVALTRAKRKLIVIGDSATLGVHPFYREFLDYVDENKCYTSIYELMED
ncbi:AAA domain-containing protein [Lunatibacter salilacus]|uniref:AAA domain-containing protein n=1 Tax=Lunatibacter salilacus TaxID=2483804 RepID=UPI00131C4EC9|nr:AAA domain-containing protein [Lunatibacter salilacus]